MAASLQDRKRYQLTTTRAQRETLALHLNIGSLNEALAPEALLLANPDQFGKRTKDWMRRAQRNEVPGERFYGHL